MQLEELHVAPTGQKQVLESWRNRLRGRTFISQSEIDISELNRELAYVSILESDGGGFRFRLAGTGVNTVFGGEARGKTASEIEACCGGAMWTELAARALARLAPVSGVSRSPDGSLHFWLRLPLSSDGEMADLVLCHDRYLPAEAAADPDQACLRADRMLRRDCEHQVAA
jgi:hypothetical protein